MANVFASPIKALIVPAQGGTHYYDFAGEEPNPETGWSDENNWTQTPSNTTCPSGDATVCRIKLSSGQSLSDILNSVSSLSELMEIDEVDTRSAP